MEQLWNIPWRTAQFAKCGNYEWQSQVTQNSGRLYYQDWVRNMRKEVRPYGISHPESMY